MVKSMTGYGRGERHFQGQNITIELRAVNHRYFDFTPRVPRAYLYLEDTMKNQVHQQISRGKIELFVSIEHAGDIPPKISVNHSTIQSYCDVFEELSQTYSLKNDMAITQLMQLPDIFHIQNDIETSQPMADEILSVLQTALQDFDTMRSKEGQQLEKDILARSHTIEQVLQKIQNRSPETIWEYRKKLEKRMEEILSTSQIDESRILAEAAIFADKIAIDEETVRIYSHLAQLKHLLQQEGGVGRKLDFLVQELNREANTIGSKCNDTEISHWVVDLKAELEKIREQIQNME